MGKYDFINKKSKINNQKDKPTNKSGEVTHFQALATAVSGTVGNGNIAGVALAIAIGGPGATFWMILCGILGMSTKFVECTLGVKYREINNQGVVFGGPMYYLSKGLKEKGFVQFGKILAISLHYCASVHLLRRKCCTIKSSSYAISCSFNLTGGNARTIIGIIMMIIVGL